MKKTLMVMVMVIAVSGYVTSEEREASVFGSGGRQDGAVMGSGGRTDTTETAATRVDPSLTTRKRPAVRYLFRFLRW